MAVAAAAIAAGGLLAACGGDDNPEPTALDISTEDAGNGATLDVPSTI